MKPKYHFITLTNEKIVQAFFQTEESEAAIEWNGHYAYKDLTNGNICRKIAFVDANGNKITVS